MEHVLIRTNASKYTGLGHLVRCVTLAKTLLKNNVRVSMVLDYLESNTRGFLNNIDTIALHDSLQETLDEIADANLVSEIINENNISWIILDDYRLQKPWESIIQKQGVRLCVIDDILRQHQCNLLVDIRWRGTETHSAYDKLVQTDTIKLLGPKYALLSKEYNKPDLADNNPELFHILVGDSGSIDRSKSIIESLIKHQGSFNKKIYISLVLGPYSKATQSDCNYFQKYENVELLIGKKNLFPYLKKTHFYIGASGGIIYQLLALKIPALTFSLTDNQKNDITHLEDIGHYFHLNQWPENYEHDLVQFILSVVNQYPTFRALVSEAKIVIDANGADRIVNTILNHLSADKESSNLKASQQERASDKEVTLSESHKIREVANKDINHYLSCRNLHKNRSNMIQSTNISILHHYAWWFNTQRESYLLSKHEVPCLYIWHEQRQHKDNQYLIGGWFVCNDNTDFQDALISLSWQLKICKKSYPDIPWIAVIHRKNKFVKLLNDYLGFRELHSDQNEGSGIREAINNIFQHADNNNYHYVTYP